MKNEIEPLFITQRLSYMDIQTSKLFTNSDGILIENALKDSRIIRELAGYVFENNLYEIAYGEKFGYEDGTAIKIELPLKKFKRKDIVEEISNYFINGMSDEEVLAVDKNGISSKEMMKIGEYFVDGMATAVEEIRKEKNE